MRRRTPLIALALLGLMHAAPPAPAAAQEPADMILTASRIWTADPDRPWAEAVAIRGDRILAVGDPTSVRRHRASYTRVIDLPGRFIVPGFIDNHTHFAQAGALLLGVNLLDVADQSGLVRRVREARDRMPAGAWLVGGDWGAYEAWALGATGREAGRVAATPEFRPHRAMIDSITPNTPVLLNRWDRSVYLANGRALQIAGVTCAWAGVECEAGRPTGRLTPDAAARVRAVIPPKSMEQRLAEANAALRQLREFGVTTIHDNTSPEQLAVYQELLARGELTTRVYARHTLDQVGHLAALGIRHGFGNDWIRIGGLKGFVDGIMGNSSARFYEPYLHTGERGTWRPMMGASPGGDGQVADAQGTAQPAPPAGNMERLLLDADDAELWPQVHAIGDEAIDTLLDLYERVFDASDSRDRRFRVIHAQVLRGPEVAERMARLGIIAEVQPYHAIDDMRWMEERIGERSRWAYAFRTLHDAGVRLSFGSDWPGTNASWYSANPLLGIYAAVTRQTLDGLPTEGWFPEERIDVETALRAYTINNAYAAGEEELKGSITPGKLADLVVLDRDPFRVHPAELKELQVLMTIVGGNVVHEVRASRASVGAMPVRR